jgi:hypothetical protein
MEQGFWNSMPTYVKINDQVRGPFTDAEVRQKLSAGEITPQTPAWRVGMAEWTTVAAFFPAQPPPLPSTAAAAPDPGDLRATMAFVNATVDRLSRPFQPDALERVAALGNALLARLDRRLGATARPNFTFFSHRVATAAIQRLRLDTLKGASLTPKGEEFAAQIAAYLAMVALRNWKRRGLKIEGRVHFAPGAADNEIYFEASRQREGNREVYIHDFLRDTHGLLLNPPDWFPYLKDQVYAMESLTMPSPEQLYLYGVSFLQSPSAYRFGTWPTGPKPGGRPEDFDHSKELLVDDLHEDCELPRDDEALRKLSLWIVFPPYGWHQNDANDYNLMTLFSQISERQVVSRDAGINYLRALLRSQAVDIRNLAARCLMVYRVPPRDAIESGKYQQALNFRDQEAATLSMGRFQRQIEGVENTPAWREQIDEERQAWFRRTPASLSLQTAAENDPEYIELGGLPEDDVAGGIRGIESLMRRYPDDWTLKVIHASLVMQSPDARRGEARLRELIQDPPDSCEGHSRLGTLLKRQGRLEESLAVYQDEVRRWPWNYRAVDSCLWLVTNGMTRFPETVTRAA